MLLFWGGCDWGYCRVKTQPKQERPLFFCGTWLTHHTSPSWGHDNQPALWEQVLSATDPWEQEAHRLESYTLHAARNMQMHTHKNAESPVLRVAHRLLLWTCASTSMKSLSLWMQVYLGTTHTHVCLHAHTHTPFQDSDDGWLLFLAKNYMSFNVITGLTRTDSLCLLLCAGPPWEWQTGAFTEHLSNL